MPAKLTYVKGDVTQPIGSGERVIIHCCNDIDVWGAGVVLVISERFGKDPHSPEGKYHEWARKKKIRPRDGQPEVPFEIGQVQFVPVGSIKDCLWVGNMIGQVGVGQRPDGSPPIDYPAIAQCLIKVEEFCKLTNAEVHCPKFGAGLAGGNWAKIERLINQYLVAKGINVTVYEYTPPKNGRNRKTNP